MIFFMSETVQTILRAVLKVGGGFLVAKGLASEAQAAEIAGCVVTLVGIAWGIIAARKKPAE